MEVKSRVSFNSENDTIAAIKNHIGMSFTMTGYEKFFFEISSDESSKLHNLLGKEGISNKNRYQSECIQLLHHVYVYSASSGLFIIGNNEKLLFGAEVSFSPELLSAYSRLVNYIYTEHFEFFYANTLNDFPEEKVEKALKLRNEKKKKNGSIDMHSFWTNYRLWRALNVNVDDSLIKFPLPPCSRLIPIQHSWWNATKGPSDTTTKLMDNCEEHLGIRSPHTIATARMLGIGGVAFHRLHQILGTKRESSAYGGVDIFRRAANKRSPFWQSLVVLCQFFNAEVEKLSETTLNIATPMVRRRPTRSTSHVQPVDWITKKISGITPGKKIGRPAKRAKTDVTAHEIRQKNCIGIVLVVRTSIGRCVMCKKKTQYYCTGCKNYLCVQTMSDCSEKINAMIQNGVIEEENRPAPFLQMTEHQKKNGKTEYRQFQIRNSCYHIAHANQFKQHFLKKNEETDTQTTNT